MEKLPGALLFLSAAIYLTVQGNMDVITLLAAIACAICGAISLTPNSVWAVVGGVGIISISLSLQTAMNYLCQTCLRADVLILLAVICLSLTQRGKVKIPSMAMAGVMTAVMLTITIFVAPVNSGNASDNKSMVKTPQLHTNIIKLAENKPVLLFSPKCPACIEITASLSKLDPIGRSWQPVQTGGDLEEGKKYLRDKGYRGEVIFQRYAGMVPTLVVFKDGQTDLVQGHDSIIRIIQNHMK